MDTAIKNSEITLTTTRQPVIRRRKVPSEDLGRRRIARLGRSVFDKIWYVNLGAVSGQS